METVEIKIGIDIISSYRFLKSYKAGGEAFIKRLFTPQEIRQNTKEQLVSIFCLKESIIKALQLPQDSWLTINTNRRANGKVECSFIDPKIAKMISSIDTSISHEGQWIVAAAIVVLQ